MPASDRYGRFVIHDVLADEVARQVAQGAVVRIQVPNRVVVEVWESAGFVPVLLGTMASLFCAVALGAAASALVGDGAVLLIAAAPVFVLGLFWTLRKRGRLVELSVDATGHLVRREMDRDELSEWP